mmetsp:Transcript_1966/g.6585  ORF Transcript_1966/g.6585 Transcript_1966/m.6585 type:complete len:240 (-) Transcript_1966:1255-1974(-)
MPGGSVPAEGQPFAPSTNWEFRRGGSSRHRPGITLKGNPMPLCSAMVLQWPPSPYSSADTPQSESPASRQTYRVASPPTTPGILLSVLTTLVTSWEDTARIFSWTPHPKLSSLPSEVPEGLAPGTGSLALSQPPQPPLGVLAKLLGRCPPSRSSFTSPWSSLLLDLALPTALAAEHRTGAIPLLAMSATAGTATTPSRKGPHLKPPGPRPTLPAGSAASTTSTASEASIASEWTRRSSR